MSTITVEVSGLKQTIRSLSDYGAAAQDMLRDLNRTTAEDVKRAAVLAAPVASGRLVKSIGIKQANNYETAWVRPTARWGIFREFGSGPYGSMTNSRPRPEWHRYRPYHKFPPWKHPVFRAWAKRRNMNPFLAARGIFRRQGTRAQPFLGPAADRVLPDYMGGAEKILFWYAPKKVNQSS